MINTRIIKKCLLGLLSILIAINLVLPSVHAENQDASPHYKLISLEGTITAGSSQFLESTIEDAIEENYDGIIIVLDTPGGLVDATLDIMRKIVNSPIPVITYVGPSGAMAASAGTFILMSGHVAAMAPGTTCGAAMPVTMQPGAEGTTEADDKTVQFLAGHLKSIAEEQNRPVDVVERFVTENLTLSAREALEKEVIEFNEPNVESLMEAIHGYEVMVDGEMVELNTRDAMIEETEMTLTQSLSHFISNPQVAMILLLIGIYGIIFGLNAPGTLVPELTGVVALILALFGLGMFEANVLGIVLIILAVILFIAEMFTPTFGVLTTAGVVSLVIGGFFLPVEPMMPAEWFVAFQMTIIGMAIVTAIFIIIVVTKLASIWKKKAVHSKHGMEGYYGKVIEAINPKGSVKIRGEIWNARSIDGKSIPQGTTVLVEEGSGIELKVTPVEQLEEHSVDDQREEKEKEEGEEEGGKRQS